MGSCNLWVDYFPKTFPYRKKFPIVKSVFFSVINRCNFMCAQMPMHMCMCVYKCVCNMSVLGPYIAHTCSMLFHLNNFYSRMVKDPASIGIWSEEVSIPLIPAVNLDFTHARVKLSDMSQRAQLSTSSISSFHNVSQVKPWVQPDFVEDFQNVLVRVQIWMYIRETHISSGLNIIKVYFTCSVMIWRQMT